MTNQDVLYGDDGLALVRHLEDCLTKYKRKMISIDTLFSFCSGKVNLTEFSAAVLSLKNRQVLVEVNASQRYIGNAALCLKYRIQIHFLHSDAIEAVQREIVQKKFHPLMDLSYYYLHELKDWETDRKYLLNLSAYLEQYGLPMQSMGEQERSYRIFGDEKFLLQGGKRILERTGLLKKFKLRNEADPLMIAVNFESATQAVHRHLIVENKATYYGLLETLPSTRFTSLVFGSGWKIVANLKQLPKQLGLENCAHAYYYFGDLDNEGITIWHTLFEEHEVQPAIEFYRQLLSNLPSPGKSTQLSNAAAIRKFSGFFTEAEAERICDILLQGYYYPQETLDTRCLADCWRKYDE